MLKEVPADQPTDLVSWRHGLIFHLHATAADLVGRPQRVQKLPSQAACQSFLQTVKSGSWQLLQWRPGTSIEKPTRSEVASAAVAIGRLHRSAAQFNAPWPGPSRRGWQVRASQLTALAADGWPVTEQQLTTDIQRTVAQVSQQAADTFAASGGTDIADQLATLVPPLLPVQPVLRDIWWGHVLFSTTPVGLRSITGVIDFDAAGVDTPATDLARLLGSWQLHCGNPGTPLTEAWPEAVAAYVETNRPPANFWEWVQRYHDTAVVCGLAQWCRWILTESRYFPNTAAVKTRINALLRGLPGALHRLGAG